MTPIFLKQFLPFGWKESRLVFVGKDLGGAAEAQNAQAESAAEREKTPKAQREVLKATLDELIQKRDKIDAELMPLIGCMVEANEKGFHERVKNPTPEQEAHYQKYRKDFLALTAAQQKNFAEVTAFHEKFLNEAKGVGPTKEKAASSEPSPLDSFVSSYQSYLAKLSEELGESQARTMPIDTRTPAFATFVALMQKEHPEETVDYETWKEAYFRAIQNPTSIPLDNAPLSRPETAVAGIPDSAKANTQAPEIRVESLGAVNIPQGFQAYVDRQLQLKIDTEQLSDQSLKKSMLSDWEDMKREMAQSEPRMRWVMASMTVDKGSSPDKAMTDLQAKIDAEKATKTKLDTIRNNPMATPKDIQDVESELASATKAKDQSYEDLRLVIEDYFAEREEIRQFARNEMEQRLKQISAGYLLPDQFGLSNPQFFLEERIPPSLKDDPDFLKKQLGETPHRLFSSDDELRSNYPNRYLALGQAYQEALSKDRRERTGLLDDYGTMHQIVNRIVELNDLKKYGSQVEQLPFQLLAKIHEESEKAKSQDLNAVIARARSRHPSGPSEALASR